MSNGNTFGNDLNGGKVQPACRFCIVETVAHHYVGGGQWVCFQHFMSGLIPSSLTAPPTVATIEERALAFIRKHPDGVAAGDLGAHLWSDRKGRIVSSNGGGDYAAQMLLGRMRKKGLVRVLRGEGSSRWGAT